MDFRSKQTSQITSDSKIIKNRELLYQLFESRPIDDVDTLTNLTLFMRSGSLAKLLFIDEIYREILRIPGQIFEFGTWLGGTTCLLENLRAIHEPYNHLRKIYTFDTFSGYLNEYSKDETSPMLNEIMEKQVYTTPHDYNLYLERLLSFHSENNVLSHIKKFEVIRGDVVKTLPSFLASHPESIVSLAYFDLAMYEPTRFALEHVLQRSVPGTIIVLDELAHREYPGETKAFFEVLSRQNYEITVSKFLADRSFIRLL